MNVESTDQPRDVVASELRRAMGDLIPDRPPAPIFERVVAARRRRVRLRSAFAASTAALAIVATPTLLSRVLAATTVDEPAATQPAAVECPGTAPPDFFTFASTAPEPDAAPIVVATICRYGGENEPRGRGEFVGSGVVRGDELAELLRLLDASNELAGPVPCPYSFGAKHVLYLASAGGSVQRIDVHLSGCRFVATDAATYWSTDELRDFLAAHVA